MDFYSYESRLNRPLMAKLPELQSSNDRLKHVIFSAQFDRELLEHLARIADMIRALSQSREGCDFLSGLLNHKRAMLYFTQPSTRTFLSFMAACQLLGLSCAEVRDPAVSSEVKGESPFDSVRMFSSYFDVIIMRSVVPNFAECCSYLMNDLDEFNHRSVPIVNAGSGADEHPTQALLDIYTIQRTFRFTHPKDSSNWTRLTELRNTYPTLTPGLSGKVYGFCGDIGRGRTVRSLARLLARWDDVTMYFIAPDDSRLKLGADLKNWLLGQGVNVHEVDSFDSPAEDGRPVIESVDCLYMTRIQQEHDREGESAYDGIDLTRFHLNRELVGRMKDYAAVLHPFPRDSRVGEIPTEIDNDPRAMYFRQARNGMWARAALLAFLFDVDGRIASRYQRDYSDYHDYNVGVL